MKAIVKDVVGTSVNFPVVKALTVLIGFPSFSYDFNEYLLVSSDPFCWWTQDVLEIGHKLSGHRPWLKCHLFI